MRKRLGIVVVIGASLLVGQKLYKERISLKKSDKKYQEIILSIDKESRLEGEVIIAKEDNKYGLMSISGEIIKEIEYDEIIKLDNSIYLLQKNESLIAYNIKTKKEITLEGISIIGKNLYKIKQYGKYGVIDDKYNIKVEIENDLIKDNVGKILIKKGKNWELLGNNSIRKKLDKKYEDVEFGVGENIYFKNKDRWGIMTEGEEIKISPKYEKLENLNDQNIIVGYIKDKKYLINLDKKIEKEIDYDSYSREAENTIMVMKDGKIGYIDDTGREIIPIKYDGGFYFSKYREFVQLKENGMWKLLNLSNLDEKELQYSDIGEYIEGLMVVEENGKYGYIDEKGEVKIPISYEIAENFKEGMGVVAKTSGYGVIDKDGNEVLPMIYDSLVIHENYIYGKKDDKVGIFFKNGKTLLPTSYDRLSFIEKEIVLFEKDDKVGIIKLDGEENGN